MYTLMCIVMFLFLVNGNEDMNITSSNLLRYNSDDSNDMIKFKEFCQKVNLRVFAYPDITKNTIFVSFDLLDMKFKDCFEYFYIFLESRKGKVKQHKVWNIFDKENKTSYVFENITCGIYRILIQPCYNNSECALVIVRYPNRIKMSSNDCINHFPERLSSEKFPTIFNIEKAVVFILAGTSIILIIAVSGWIYYYCSSKKLPPKTGNIQSPIRLQKHTKNIHVYILHFYSKNKVMKNQVKIMKNFLLNSSYFSSVKEIHEELTEILFDANHWLHNMLEIKGKDGAIKKIILIDSEEFQDEEYEIENRIFCEFIEKLSNNVRCRTDFECLFIVRLDDINTTSDRIKKLHRRVCYRIPHLNHLSHLNHHYNHLNELCHNLKTISEFDNA